MRRLTAQLYLDILKACIKPAAPTKLTRRLNSAYIGLRKNADKLISLGYLQKVQPEDPKNKRTIFRYETTVKGAQLLRKYRELMQALEELS